MIPTAKNKLELENQCVYKISCNNFNKSYVIPTNRIISARRDKHVNAVKNDRNSSEAQHVASTKHKINFKNTKMIANVECLHKLIVRGAIKI